MHEITTPMDPTEAASRISASIGRLALQTGRKIGPEMIAEWTGQICRRDARLGVKILAEIVDEVPEKMPMLPDILARMRTGHFRREGREREQVWPHDPELSQRMVRMYLRNLLYTYNGGTAPIPDDLVYGWARGLEPWEPPTVLDVIREWFVARREQGIPPPTLDTLQAACSRWMQRKQSGEIAGWDATVHGVTPAYDPQKQARADTWEAISELELAAMSGVHGRWKAAMIEAGLWGLVNSAGETRRDTGRLEPMLATHREPGCDDE